MANKNTTWIGIDVSKTDLEIYCYNNKISLPKSTQNTPKGIRKIINILEKCQDPHVVFEATGGYEKLLLSLLQNAAIKTSCVNPARVRHYARSKGKLAKTDPIDAKIITDFAEHVTPPPPPATDPILEEIRETLKLRKFFQDTQHRLKMQLERPQPRKVEVMIKAEVKRLDKKVEQLNKLVIELKEKSSSLKNAVSLLTNTAGVGDNTALSLLSEMPELGTISNRQAASLAGLAPFNRDSGKMRGKRTIYGGRTNVRRALYMAALVGTKHNHVLREFYQRLLEKGKPKKLALIAVARKLLTHLNSLMKSHLQQHKRPICEIIN